jgi:hypothetical protein
MSECLALGKNSNCFIQFETSVYLFPGLFIVKWEYTYSCVCARVGVYLDENKSYRNVKGE